ncbi:ABC transporter ATP-binding protein [Geminicoccaceae bacterium 1502E]|nr:ABC transporter ATP-binding protein [Geminicoccaceae bacterium 1502E]
MSGALLEAEGLEKSFGAVHATRSVSLDVRHGEVHALIGPNGAGKTTLVSQLAGELRPDAGRIRLAGRDVTAMAMHRRVRLGMARSFQISSAFMGLSLEQNVSLSVQARQGHSFRFWGDAGRDRTLREEARAVLGQLGLAERAETAAAAVSHGERRVLEVAMALATGARILLLDEPMAGVGLEEGRRMVEMLRSLKASYGILLVEHDMDAVFALADRITVLVHGSVVATGSPAEIRADAEVRRAYLGEEDDALLG